MRTILITLLLIVLVGCNNYGTRLEFANGELYFGNDVAQGDAVQLGQFLQDNGFFEQAKSVQLLMDGDTRQVNLIMTNPGEELTPKAEQALQDLSIILSEKVFEGEAVQVSACDRNFTPVN